MDRLYVLLARGPDADSDFVELETEGGVGVGASSGAEWSYDSEQRVWKLGPFASMSEIARLTAALDKAQPVIVAAREDARRLADAIEDLQAFQNGSPLPTWTEGWTAAMAKCDAALAAHEAGK